MTECSGMQYKYLIIQKLPYMLHDKWRNIVFQAKEMSDKVTFGALVNAVRKEDQKVNEPTFG